MLHICHSHCIPGYYLRLLASLELSSVSKTTYIDAHSKKYTMNY